MKTVDEIYRERRVDMLQEELDAIESIIETGEERDTALLAMADLIRVRILWLNSQNKQKPGSGHGLIPGQVNTPDPDISKTPDQNKSEEKTPQKIKYGEGATRNDIGPARFDLIDPWGLQEVAEVYGEGAISHGDKNWLQGMPEAVIWNHLERHINLYKQGDRSEPHLGKAIWGFLALIRYRENPVKEEWRIP